MVRPEVVLLLVGMVLTTYIPRVLPVPLLNKIRMNRYVERFLRLVPYTAMATLVFPSVFTLDAEHAWIGFVGVSVAGILAYLKCPMVVSVVAAISVNLVIYLII